MSQQTLYASTASLLGSYQPWTNIDGVVGSTTGNYAEQKTDSNPFMECDWLLGEGYGFPAPGPGHTVTGVEVGFWAYYTATVGQGTLGVCLAFGQEVASNIKYITLTATPTFYTLGSSTDTWGINPDLLISSSDFGAGVRSHGTNSNRNFVDVFVNTLPITIFES